MDITLTLTADEEAAAVTIPLLDGETREQAIARYLRHEGLLPIVERVLRERRETEARLLQQNWDVLTPENKVAVETFTRAKLATQSVVIGSVDPK